LIFLPRSIVSVLPPEIAAPPSAGPRAGVRRRIVLADDNRDGAESLRMLLEMSGHEIYVAHTGIDALKVTEEHRPEICILDIGMPGLNGYEVADRIRSESWGTQIVLIAVTGYGQQHDKLKARATGFDHHLTKPIDPSALENLIEAART